MSIFAIFTVFVLGIFLLGIRNRRDHADFMDRNFTTVLKGISILTVVWAHTGAALGVEGIQFIAGVGVWIFLFCSGYGLELSWQHRGLKEFWKKRFLSVFIIFWAVELVGLTVIGRFSLGGFIKDCLFIEPDTGYGWYMQYLVICYLIFWLNKSALGSRCMKEQLVAIFASFAIWFVIDSLFFADPGMPFLRAGQMLAFPLGVLVGDKREDGRKVLVQNRHLLISGGILGCLFMAITQLSAVKHLPYMPQNIFSLFTVMPLALAVITVCTVFPVITKSAFLDILGSIRMRFIWYTYLYWASLILLCFRLLNSWQ